jgi:hypothetical protein
MLWRTGPGTRQHDSAGAAGQREGQREGLLEADGGGGVVAGQLLHDVQAVEETSFGEAVVALRASARACWSVAAVAGWSPPSARDLPSDDGLLCRSREISHGTLCVGLARLLVFRQCRRPER